MPRIIRRALYQKVRDLRELREFQADFELLSGMKLAFVDELGMGEGCVNGNSPLCRAMASCEAGRALCTRLRQGLFARALEEPAMAICDAGMAEVVVPLRIGGIHAGFFVFAGASTLAPDQPARHKARHLLARAGVRIDDAELDQLLARSPVISQQVLAAYQRVVCLAAKQIGLRVTDQLADPDTRMPPAVLKACGFIRSRAVVDDISLSLVARHCAVSEGHLSRMFHHATGLTFREYVAQVRIEHAKNLLLHSSKGITEIAFESGFQSLSQFHRVFRKAFAMSPGQMRREKKAAHG
jgi:AraC-like DNA-binding protein/ligand-binding sensor protein